MEARSRQDETLDARVRWNMRWLLGVAGFDSVYDSRRGGGPAESYCSCKESPDAGAYHSWGLIVLNSETETDSGGLVKASTSGSRWSSTAHHPHELGVHLDCFQCELPKLPQ